MRKIWIDNLRTTVVLLVLLFHVFYYNSSCCQGSNFGGFADQQWQDGILYALYPWMMILLFVLAGVSSHYAIDKYSPREFIRSRTVRLLVPGTIGLFVWQWITGYFNVMTVGAASGIGDGIWGDLPWGARYMMMAVTGGGHLWFIQLLWVFSLFTPWLPKVERTPKHIWIYLLLGFLLLFAAEQTVADLPFPQHPLSLYNVFRPIVYLVCYLLGFYLFTEQAWLDLLEKLRWLLIVVSVGASVAIVVCTMGTDPYSPAFLRSWYNNLYAWVMCLTLVAAFRHWADKNSSNPMMKSMLTYLNKASYGLYILHYLLIVGVGYVLRTMTSLAPWAVYVLMGLSVFVFTPLLYEVLRRIPVVRWCVLGMKTV